MIGSSRANMKAVFVAKMLMATFLRHEHPNRTTSTGRRLPQHEVIATATTAIMRSPHP